MSHHSGPSHPRQRTVLATAACAVTIALSGCSSSGGGAAPSSAGRSGSATAAASSTCSTKAAAGFKGTSLPFGTAAPTGPSSALEVSAGRPQVSSVPSGHDGYRLVQVPVRSTVRTNGTFAIEHGQFELVDSSGHLCKQPSIDPVSDGFVALTVDEAHAGSGRVAFLVPTSVATDRLTVRYLPAEDASSASLGWRAGAAKPTPSAAANSCDGKKSDLSTAGSDKAPFGHSIRHGDDVVSSSVDAARPHRRAFKPGPTQPNDVDAVDITVRVSAQGADSYVDRRSFALVDGSGRLCRGTGQSQGETLSSALVKKGHAEKFRIVFWAPKGSAIHGLRLVQLTKPGGSKAQSVWSDTKLTLNPLT